jgi:uncharacterized FlaG/YvyC family protein
MIFNAKQRYTLTKVSTFTMSIVLGFNDSSSIEYDTLLSNISTVKDDKYVKELLDTNLELLTKMKIIEKKDNIYTINMKYNNKKLSIPFDIGIKAEASNEKDSTIKEIDIERIGVIDAYIVRNMKTNKTLKYNELITTVIEQLQQRFKPDVKNIKYRIDDLITRDYIKRCETDRNILEYVA